MSSSGQELNNPSDLKYSSQLRNWTIAYIVLAIVAAGGRLLARRISRLPILPDDILAFVGTLSSLGLFITVLIEADHNALSVVEVASAWPFAKRYQLLVALGTFYTISIVVIKMSLLFLYRRVFTMNHTWFRVCWWGIFIFLFPIWTTWAFAQLGVQSSDPYSDKKALNDISTPILGFCNALTDILLLILPIRSTLRLNLPLKQKIALMAIFVLGSLGSTISLVRVAALIRARTEKWDPIYAGYYDVVISNAEVTISLICACLPVTKPLLVRAKEVTMSVTTSMNSLLSHKTSRSTMRTGSNSERSHGMESSSIGGSSQQGIQKQSEYEVNTESVHPASFEMDRFRNPSQAQV